MKKYIDLINTNFTIPDFLYPTEKIESSIVEYLKSRKYEPDSKGLEIAREAIINNLYKDQNKENVFITSSTSESYSMIFNNFCKPRDAVLFPNPTYPLFEYLAEFSHLNAAYYKLDIYNNWKINTEELEKKINTYKSVKCIVLITPNNPTGAIISRLEFMQIQKIALKYNLFLVIDNVFDIFTNSEILQISPNDITPNLKVFWCNGISKMFALPDLKLAWIYCQNCSKDEIEKLEIYNDTYLSANYLSQSILPILFTASKEFQSSMIAKIRNNFEIFSINLDRKYYKFNQSSGGIHTIISLKQQIKVSDQTVQEKLLKEENVHVHPGSFYNLESDNVSFVVSMLNSEENILEGIDRLNSFAKNLSI